MTTRAGKGSLRFSPGDFAYNGRASVAILPAMAVVIGFGGPTVVAVCTLGAMAAYLLDALRQKEAALGAVWMTLAAANLFLITGAWIGGDARPLALSLLSLAVCSGVLFLLGCWATLQFRWVQLQYPPVALALERLILSGGVTICGPAIAWGTVAAVGAPAAPFYTACVMPGLHALLSVPLVSSFHLREAGRGGGASGGGRDPAESAAQGRLEAACAASVAALLPAAMYAAIHWAAIGRAEHFWGLVLVLSVPCLAVLSAPCGLWWLPLRQQHREALRWSAALAALGAAVAGVEERVVFAAFGEYILLHPPWDWVLVTVALYGHGAVVLLHLSGALRSPPVHAMTSAGLVLCCFVACLTVGLPLAVVPAPLVSSLGLALFYRSRSMREYVLFLVGAGIAGLWFVGHHFWFLDVRVGEWWSVQRVCALLLAYTAPTVLLPGLLLSGAPRWLCGASLAAHALLLCAAEVALAGGNVAEVGEVLPAFCVAATSAVGALAARRLGASGRVPPWSAWLAQVICGAKLAVLLLPSPRQTVHVVLLAAATGLPLVLHRPSPSDAVRAKPARRPRVHPGVAAACAGAILLSVWAARHTLFAALAEASGHTLGEGAALGLLMLFAAAMLLPMVAAHFGDSMPARQAMAALVSTGAMITALRPPLPLSAVCHPDHEHHHRARWFCLSLFDGLEGITRESDDIAIYGSGIARKEHWGLWLLVLAVLAGLAAASQRRSLRGSGILGRLLLGLISGGSVGGFAALELFPGRETLQLIVLGSCLLAAVAVVLAVLPNQASPVLLPPVLLLWAALLPALLMLERSTPIPIPDNLRFFPDPRADLPRRYRMMRLASVLVTYASQSALLSLCFKLKVSRGADPGDLPEGAPAAGAAFPSLAGCGPAAAQLRGFLGSCLPSAGMSLGAYSRARHRGTGAPSLAVAGLGWLPLAGNLVTILCFLLCVALSSTMYEGSAAVALPLSSILLMLSQDPVLLPSLTLRRRYVPPLLAAVCHLTILGVHGILDVAHMQPQALGDRSPFMASAVQLACLLCALPSNALFAWYLWDWSRHGLAAPLLAAPLNLAALGLTDVPSVRLLSAIGLAAAATQWVAASRSRATGLRVI